MENRVIKFRFWNPDKFMMQDHKGWVEDIGINEAIECSKNYGYKIMQFTGLTDKNGKEVFEGDLAIINNEVCQVKFCNFFICGWEFKPKTPGSYSFNDTCTSFNDTGCTDFEIIGNIYENPNLL